MSRSIDVRFAMNTWGLTFQEMVAGRTTTYLLSKEMGNLLRLLFQDQAVLHQVACCSVNDRGLFNLYINFDYPPDPYVAMKHMSKACLELNSLHFQVHDPLNFMSYVRLPFEMKEADLDNALKLIRENIPKITARVSEGMDVHVEDM